MHIRINGLVKIFNQVRQQLAAGIPPSEVTVFRERVQHVIAQVEQICRQQRGTPQHLPAPSRNAYNYLKNLDLENLPVNENPHNMQPPAGELRIRNIVGTCELFSAEMWDHLSELLTDERSFARLHRTICDNVADIEAVARQQNLTPAHLPKPSQMAYCWLVFLSDPDNFRSHLAGLAIANRVLNRLSGNRLEKPVQIQFSNMRYIYRYKTYSDHIVLRCSEGLISAPENVWTEILQRLFSRRRFSHKLLDEFVQTAKFQQIIAEMDGATEPLQSQTKGQVHDLDAIFERVNNHYFNGKMDRPNLHWNEMLTTGKMGHYHQLRDTIMLSVTLDQPNVPDFVVDYVMYHELLHKKHGIQRKNGRYYGHTGAFRREEKKFPDFERAMAFLNSLSLDHRDTKPQNNSGLVEKLRSKFRKNK